MRCWHGYLSGTRCKWFAYGPADATATPSSLGSLKSKMFYRLVLAYPGCPGKEAVKRVLVFTYLKQSFLARVAIALVVANAWDMRHLPRHRQQDMRRVNRLRIRLRRDWDAVKIFETDTANVQLSRYIILGIKQQQLWLCLGWVTSGMSSYLQYLQLESVVRLDGKVANCFISLLRDCVDFLHNRLQIVT